MYIALCGVYKYKYACMPNAQQCVFIYMITDSRTLATEHNAKNACETLAFTATFHTCLLYNILCNNI